MYSFRQKKSLPCKAFVASLLREAIYYIELATNKKIRNFGHQNNFVF